MKNSMFSIINIVTLVLSVIIFLPDNLNAGELPRYASLRDNKVNMRVGPGAKYPIKWELTRKHMPVKIVREFETWRKIELFDGDTVGWVHKNLLSSKKRGIIINGEQKIRKKPKESSTVVLRLEEGVIVKMDDCSKGWCSVEVSGYKGFIRSSEVWGNKTSDE